MPSEQQATTLRCDKDLLDQIQIEMVRRKVRSRNELVESLLREWLRQPEGSAGRQSTVRDRAPIDQEQLRRTIAESISRHLVEQQGWINEAILDIQLFREGESVFGSRIDHFHTEKDFLADALAPWLVERIFSILRSGKRVLLVVDSGTTLYAVFRRLEEELIRKAEREDVLKAHEDPRDARLVIVTNNIAGVDSYMTISRLHKFRLVGGGDPVVLSEVVPCRLLAGTVLTKYAAVTGEDTNQDLARLRDSQPARTTVMIGLIAGHWVWIPSAANRHPAPLARGRGQVEFKQTMMDVCDELFLLTPLGKVFVNCGLDDINEVLSRRGEARGGGEDDKPYGAVQTTGKEPRVKLVSTIRSGQQLLFTHGQIVNGICSPIAAHPAEQDPGLGIEDIKHMMIPFDPPGDRDAQRQAEFPHELDSDAMRRFFHIH